MNNIIGDKKKGQVLSVNVNDQAIISYILTTLNRQLVYQAIPTTVPEWSIQRH